jgi:hypothetical protein
MTSATYSDGSSPAAEVLINAKLQIQNTGIKKGMTERIPFRRQRSSLVSNAIE